MIDTTSFMNYQDALNLSPEDLLSYLEEVQEPVIIQITCDKEAEQAIQLLHAFANVYAYLSTLDSYAKVAKRQLARKGKGPAYEDMIDKDTIITNALSSLTLQYRSISKAISLYMDEISHFHSQGQQGNNA
jgi:hypothetical protein